MEPDEREVLRRCLVPRSAGTIAFLHAEAEPGARLDVDAALAALAARGRVVRDAEGRWGVTEAGRAVLMAVSHWAVTVEVVEAEPGPDGLVDVHVAVTEGRPLVGDWFRVPTKVGTLGRIVAYVAADPGRAVVHVDVDVDQGDVLQRFDPRL